MQSLKVVLCVLGMLSLSACCNNPSTPQTVKVAPISACLTQCDLVVKPVNGSELEIRRWEFQVIEQLGQCRRLHAECADWSSK